MIYGINRIKTARNIGIENVNYMDYLAEEYNKLEKANYKPFDEWWACETILMTIINGNIEYFSADLESLCDLYHYIDLTIVD